MFASLGLLAALLGAPVAQAGGCGETCTLEARHGPAALSEADYRELLATWAEEPLGEPTQALETLLFHWDGTKLWLDTVGAPGLSPQQEAFLRYELSRDSYDMEMRLVDDTGAVRATVSRTDVPFDHKEHLAFELDDSGLQAFITSGRSKRVGLHHLWSRW